MFSEVAEIALVAARLGHFQQLPKTRVIIMILNFTRPHSITYTKQIPAKAAVTTSEEAPKPNLFLAVTRTS